MTTVPLLDTATKLQVRRALADAGASNPDLTTDLIQLSAKYGARSGAPLADLVAVVARVKARCPGPFEPAWPGEAGARGSREFRRRYPDVRADESVSGKVLAERLDRDAKQVREALVEGSTVGSVV